ncbi:MAG: hypothetical protein QOF60_2909 [Actinomycetota bacterium]|nr:hypothetical protein [Actinomycetota bacterium]
MFRVENADFIADKLASELLPDQEFREAAKNGEEAIRRRFFADGRKSGGRIEIDVDWPLHAETGGWYVSCSDNGDGMNRGELQKYTLTLAVQGAGRNQSLTGNQGMGLKISGPTRHKEGVLIRSMKDGERTMLQIGWNKSDKHYDLIPLGPNGENIVSVPEAMFPSFVIDQGSGTVVTFLGNAPDENTLWPPGRPKNWLFKYLNQRFFRFSHDGIDMLVRQPAGDIADWPRTRGDADRGKSFNLAAVKGTAAVWDDAADKGGPGNHDYVELPGDPLADVPAARIHWWVLPTGPGTDVSTRTAGGGSLAVLYQNELHDWRTSSQANPFFARLGVLFGKTRIAFVIEPLGSTVASDFARSHVLIGGKALFETDTWLVWSDQFRTNTPARIKEAMQEEQARLQIEDPDRARRIQNRLKDVMQLLRPRRFRAAATGDVSAGGALATGPGGGTGTFAERPVGDGKKPAGAGTTRGIGSVLTQEDTTNGDPASEVYALLQLHPKWVTEEQAAGMPIVNGEGKGLHDRAAALVGEDGARASILLLNREFRGYQTILAAVSEWANPEGDEAKAAMIETFTQEWVEQKMVEAVNGLRQLENGSSWTPIHFDDALSPVALTAAFMADRYHTLREVKRQAGGMQPTAGVGS